MMREQAPQATHWRYKDDRRGQGNFRVVQKSLKYLPENGPEHPTYGHHT